MAIDWIATGTMMQAWAGFAQAAAIAFAAWKAADTFRAWRMQKLEERRIEVAEHILTIVYRIRTAFSSIRSPFMNGFELEKGKETLNSNGSDFGSLSENKQRGYSYAQAIYNRIDRFAAEWNDLVAVIPVGIALFGQEIEKPLDDLWRQQVVVRLAADGYAEASDHDQEFVKEIKADLWERKGHSDDKVGRKIDELIEGLESRLLPVIRAGGHTPR